MSIGWIILEVIIKAIVILVLVLLSAAVSVYLERKISAFIQMRIGPNRVGPWGILQPVADVIKLIMKEDIIPKNADSFIFGLAPLISLGVAMCIYAVVPFADPIKIGDHYIQMGIAPDANIGILFVVAMTSLGVYGIVLGGWSSNSKYSLLGGLRSSAQMISYEISMGLAILSVVLVSGSFSLSDIVNQQVSHWGGFRWNIFVQPLGFLIFFVTALAESNRAPFDLPEAEQELVGGYNTEFSGMRFGMYYLSEYANVGTTSLIMTLLFLGGWTLPIDPQSVGLVPGSVWLAVVQFIVLVIKVYILVFVIMWIRWTLPRFRYDQLMNLGWKVLLPLGLLNLVLTGVGVLIFK
ncbi:MAG TPA: NADH-quinone oxidoreductase subunit NuoH [Bacteroidota bacterium]|nr:NADH-quinone oxidoreductase subunit NuoH [Candidatus Kapabacteria bacterium]HRS01837.1 NADH-quinone oxidoreductase subunit NuoH [Bacteroidota bacterium]